MSGTYEPASAALDFPPYLTAALSQRDLSLQIPVNFVTSPGVSLSAACFGDGQYQDAAFERCLANLLATGFRRFVIDVFWDAGRRVWSLCPVQVPQGGGNAPVMSSVSSVATTSRGSLSSASFTRNEHGIIGREPMTTTHVRRQESSTNEASTSTTAAGSSGTGPISSSTAASATAEPTQFSSPDGPLYELGPYNCTSTVDLSSFASVFGNFLADSATTLAAALTYLDLNLHVAAPVSKPLGPGETLNSSSLPQPSELLSSILSSNLSAYLYTPTRLREQRENVNASWFNVQQDYRPAEGYFTLNPISAPQGSFSTPDGWPNEGYIEFSNAQRLLAGFGTVDTQLLQYNFSGDDADIFPSSYLTNSLATTLSTDGSVTGGCFFNLNSSSLSSVNNSWAISSYSANSASQQDDLNVTSRSISNLTACGISPFLNSTLGGNLTASSTSAIAAYQNFARSTIWSWAPGEPRNVSSSEDDASRIRCAALDLSSSPEGRWHVADCSQHYPAACQSTAPGSMYSWKISDSRTSYSESDGMCPEGFAFAVPRTALENRYLHSTLQQQRSDAGDDSSFSAVWLNFNSLDYQGCWVRGVNTSCPYIGRSGDSSSRTVVIPTVAAIIIFVLAVLTFFVKCASNRQNSRRRRRRRGIGEGEWDYEGVPS